MIPESAGATPYGIFLLADKYLYVARFAAHGPIEGPARLLGYHASELFLKTYLRSAGETIKALRDHGHDLSSMLDRAVALGLTVPPQVTALAAKMRDKNDYVRARYVVTEERADIPVERVMRFADTIRSSVIKALNLDEYGVPLGSHWLGALPTDYPTSVRRPTVDGHPEPEGSVE